MDKEKSEKLKEVLNKTFSNEDIEKKLKEETKILTQKKEEEEKLKLEEEKKKKLQEAIEELDTEIENEVIDEANKKNTNDTKIEEQPTNKEIIIPTVRDKKKEENESNLALYLVSIIAILLLGLTIYLYTKDNQTEQRISTVSKENNIENTQAIKKIIQEEVTKAINEKTIQEDKEVKKEPLLSTEEEKSKIEDVLRKKVALKEPIIKKEIKIVEKPVEVIKEKIVTKIVKLEKQNFKEFYNSKKYNTLKCYKFKAGDIFPNTKCKIELKTFLKANKDALRFEIIPVISEEDGTIFTKMKSNLANMEQSFQDRVKEYMFRGLGRERVLETSWQVKDLLGEDVVLTPTNYYVKSKKNNKGIIIKAYH